MKNRTLKNLVNVTVSSGLAVVAGCIVTAASLNIGLVIVLVAGTTLLTAGTTLAISI